jgi:hypothetical protein
MNSIVKELRDWTTTNAAMLASSGVQVTEKSPEPGSTHPWKASVSLVFDEVIVSFSVWERTLLQSELIVMNSKTGKTLVMDEKTPKEATAIRTDLDAVVQRLLNGSYRDANPDPKLIIS